MRTSRKPEKLVVDANPILSALLGGKATHLFFDAGISEFAVTESALDEVHYYIPKVAQKLEVNPAVVRFTLDLFAIDGVQTQILSPVDEEGQTSDRAS